MAKKKGESCQVCEKPMPNKGALAAHIRLSKDSAHTAHRAGPKLEPAPEPEPPVVEVRKEFSPQLDQAVAQQTKAAVESKSVVVSFQPPAVVQPLATAKETKPEPAPSPTGEQKPGDTKLVNPTVSQIPLEPFVAQAVASVLNAFALDPAKGDSMLTQQEVGSTGFPKAIEVSVRKYWPDLPLDHPAVLLTISGTALAAEVKKHRAPRGKKAKQPEPEPEPEAEGDDEPEPAPTPTPTPPPPPAAGVSAEAKAYAAMMGATS